MQLTAHFSLQELTRSSAALRLGLDNHPAKLTQVSLVLLCRHVLEPVREYFGPVHITSGYRSPSVNRQVGGAPSSQHQFGEAADFRVPGVSNLEVCRWIRDNLRFDQLIYEFGEAGWVHCSWSAVRLRQAVLTAQRRGGRVHMLPGLVEG